MSELTEAVDSCTIYCKIQDRTGIVRLARQLLLELHQGDIDLESDTIAFCGGSGSISFSPRCYTQGGDPFSKLILSTCAYIEGSQNGGVDSREQLVSRIESTNLALGVVANPSFDVDRRYGTLVLMIARELDGVIFNGREFFDSDGKALI